MIRNAAADLIAKHAAGMFEGGFQIPVSFHEPAVDEEGEAGPRLADILPNEAGLWSSPPAALEISDLRADLRGAIAQLPREHQDLCADLANSSISEISRGQGCSRAVIYGAFI